MAQTDHPTTTAVVDDESLPPFSGDETACVKCAHLEAFTRFRPACPRGLWEYNGRTDMRGPLPERLERQCQRCDYQWDEALNPAPGLRPATVQEIAYALTEAGRRWTVDLSPGLVKSLASDLVEMMYVAVRLDHPMWLPRPGRPLLVPPKDPVEPDPTRTSAVPIPLNERGDIQPGPTAYTTAATE
ncbi:hypothetical protein [Streptomyces murinus]|uniref:hypothetical protein n=1 Tax=Streptomyces murinus TaxID=33900 RepID=UPI0018F5CA12|nr:hypothetical protein [Streptomyces murinus]